MIHRTTVWCAISFMPCRTVEQQESTLGTSHCTIHTCFKHAYFSLFSCLPKKPDSYSLVRIKCSVTLKPLSVFNKAARTARLKTGENRETLNIVMLIKTRRANSNAIMFTTRVDMSWVKNESGQKVTTEKIAAQKRITALLLAFWRVQT